MRKWNGMNWITQQKRLAIYLRDGLSCVYCGATIETGAILSLDHIKPHSRNGDNHESNLITCCRACNTRRGNRPMTIWLRVVADFNNVKPENIQRDIRRMRSRSLKKYVSMAKQLINKRGSVANVLSGSLNRA